MAFTPGGAKAPPGLHPVAVWPKELSMNSPLMTLAERPLGARLGDGLENLRRNAIWFVLLGAALVAVGVLALGAAAFTTLVTVLFLGWLLVIDGGLQAATAFWAREWSGFFQHLLAGLLAVIVGGLILTKPVVAGLGLTLLMAVLFIVGGLFHAAAAVLMRFPSWGWAALSGAVNVGLGLLIWSEWPSSVEWVIGTFVAIDMIFKGWACLTFGLALRTSPPSMPLPSV